MAKPTGAEFAAQGAKYIGTPYTTMDCQAFVERMLQDVGVRKNWKGSNAMYRDMAWVGDVDECIAKYGSIPVGALLFIHEMDGGEIARGYHDGLGNASHVGVYTGTGLDPFLVQPRLRSRIEIRGPRHPRRMEQGGFAARGGLWTE